jgi:hypothetical protein
VGTTHFFGASDTRLQTGRFAYFMALEHGVDVDQPRNLSKAVVEKQFGA